MIPENIQTWLEENPELESLLIAGGILLVCFLVYFIVKRFVLRWVVFWTEQTENKYDDIIIKRIPPNRIAYVGPLLILYYFSYLTPEFQGIIQQITLTFTLWLVLLIFGSLLDAADEIYESRKSFKGVPIKGYLELVKILVYVFGIIITISLFTGKSPIILLGGLGALTAILLLIFQNTILSLVASIQMATNDMVKQGDWIEVPAYDADGDVLDIALHTVKIQNWDKTISFIPTHKLMDVAFKNWRGMSESGGRRIKRAIFIDLGSIKFCDQEMIERFKNFHLIGDYIARKEEELEAYNQEHYVDDQVMVNRRRLTNIGTFQAYMEAYLRNHEQINKEMTFLIRQLAPGPTGLPIEIYVFTNTTEWVAYEKIQADVFDHLLAVIPEFGLEVFQQPTGADFSTLTNIPGGQG